MECEDNIVHEVVDVNYVVHDGAIVTVWSYCATYHRVRNGYTFLYTCTATWLIFSTPGGHEEALSAATPSQGSRL